MSIIEWCQRFNARKGRWVAFHTTSYVGREGFASIAIACRNKKKGYLEIKKIIRVDKFNWVC